MAPHKENLQYGEQLLFAILSSLEQRNGELQLPSTLTLEMQLLAQLLMNVEPVALQSAMFEDPTTAADLSSQARAQGHDSSVLYKAYAETQSGLPAELVDGFIARVILNLTENTATVHVVDSDLIPVLEFTMGISAVSAQHIQVVTELQTSTGRGERTYSF